MNKRFLFIAFMIVISTLFVGCSDGKYDQVAISKEELSNRMFIELSDEKSGSVVVDKETKVMYWKSEGSYNCGVLTLLVNPDGTPRIWKGAEN